MDLSKFIKDDSLSIIVKPGAKKNEVIRWDVKKKALRVAIAAPADKGKANKEVVKFLSRLLKKDVKIKVGLRSKNKRLEIK